MNTFVCILLALVAFTNAEDCSSAIQKFRQCREDFREQQKAKRPDPSVHQNQIKDCFTKSGCKAPTFDDKDDDDNDGDSSSKDAARKCHKDIGQKAHDLVKSCIEKKTGVKLPQKQDGDIDNDHRRGGQRGENQEELKSLCSTDEQRNATRKCIKESMKGQEDREKQAEQRFNDNCNNKRSCFGKLSSDCQKKFNETKTAACDCAKSELTPKKDDFQKQAEACRTSNPSKGGDKPHKDGGSSKDGSQKGSGKDGGHRGGDKDGGHRGGDKDGGERKSFVDKAIERACGNKEDRCDKPYEPKEHKEWKGKGKGHSKGRHN